MAKRLHPLFFDTKDISLEALTGIAEALCEQQRDGNWQLGDAVRAAKRDLGSENWSQAFPEWYGSVDHLGRCEAVALAYPKQEDRSPGASWSIHRNLVNDPDRIAKVQAHVDAGHTSDEARKADTEEKERPRRLLAVDVNLYLTRTWASGGGLEAAMNVAEWIGRTVERLKEHAGVTDVVCALDSPNSFRKDLTKNWEDPYKPRATKDTEHTDQLHAVEELLRRQGFCCVKHDGFEADDILASCAAQFQGQVILMTTDKDMRQCLSKRCNLLPEITWKEDETSGQSLPVYGWVTAKLHHGLDDEGEERPGGGCTYNNVRVFGIRADQWAEFQTLAGDSGDGVAGAITVGPKTAAELLQWFGNAEGAIAAAKANDSRITKAKRQALIEFEAKLSVTRQLVTLRTDLPLPSSTRI